MSDAARDRLETALAGRYRIERTLGEGGMAMVYLARDLKHDRDVAIKVLKPDVGQTVGAERFLREIQLAARLSHPHILSLFDSGDADGLLYYVMPNVEGRSLRDRLDEARQLGVDEAVRITREVAGALDYAHRHGVVHRDIKPENIMLQDGHAMVADFGIGKAVADVEGQAFTKTGVSVGTPAYMSPEQAAGDTVDGRSDLYSLGCVLYEMLVGEQPFTGPTVQAIIAKRFVQTPADVSALRDGVSRPVARTVQTALARTPIDRFHTGADLIAAISAAEPAASAVPASLAPAKSIAVLPFASMSADPENEFFADGVTEEILSALAQISALRVAGRTSSFSFKGKQVDLKTIAEQLNVRTVLEGSVRRSGKRVRITAQLTDVADGFQLWSERYDRDVDDVFALQDEIARTIAERMKASLDGDAAQARAALEQRAPSSIEAYETYLKGRALLYKRGSSVPEGMALMRRALELDPKYGLAWSGLADAYSLLGYYAIISPEEAGPRAREAAARAVECAPDLAEAHTSLALVRLLFDWDWAGSEASFQHAMALNPHYLQGVAWYWLFYRGFACGDWQAAIDGMCKVQETDSRSAYMCAVIAIGYSAGLLGGARSLEWAERAFALEPTAYLSVWTRGMAYAANRQWADAIAATSSTLANSGRQTYPLSSLSRYYVETGDREKARSVFNELQSRAEREYIGPWVRAMVAANIGEFDTARALIDEARRRKDPGVVIFGFGWIDAEGVRAMPEVHQLLRDIDSPGLRTASASSVAR